MTNRSQLTTEMDQLEQEIKDLEIAYEQYFMGIEKREPLHARKNLSRSLRRLINRYIPQVDLRFRLQSISSRFHSYAGRWDRILRLIDEGKYERHRSRLQRTRAAESQKSAGFQKPWDDLYGKLVEAHRECGLKEPPREQVDRFMTRQNEKIREKFGSKPVDFQVVTENGKPKIKVRSKS
ncbi:MAG TPA: MXAN_5187 C-terminal domain-containing protein [Desulfuromonadales bacterium]|nr:MXAN_5187 C-terminal domain-containing protein [Desulfuromonadales bacterium]